jgi:hypothetical protein
MNLVYPFPSCFENVFCYYSPIYALGDFVGGDRTKMTRARRRSEGIE